MGKKVNLKNVRIGYVHVFKKSADSVNQQTGEPVKGKFQLTVFMDKDDPQLSLLEEAAIEVLTEGLKSAKAAEKWLDRNYGFGNHSDKCAIRDLSERDKPIEGLEEGLYFKATSQKKPKILTSEGENQTETGLTTDGEDIEGKEVYSGCFANVSVEIYYYDKFKLLNANILGVRFRADGEAFGGAGETADESDLDDEDDKPSRRKSRGSEDESPRKSRRSRDEDGEEEEAPRRRKSRHDEDDGEEDEEDSPRRSRRSRDEDDEEEERPRRRR